MFYRYELIPKEGEEDKHIGLVFGLETLLDEPAFTWSYIWDSCKWMERTNSVPSTRVGYYTELGYRLFRDAMPWIFGAFERCGRRLRKIKIEEINPDTIVYEDKWCVMTEIP